VTADLFDILPPFVRDSDTSREAAVSIAPDSNRLRALVLGFIAKNGRRGATCSEVEEALSMRHQTASARMRELALADRIVDTGLRRKTTSGRNAAVWVVAGQP